MTESESKYLKLARRAREEDNTEDAKKYYDIVRTENPDNIEARFYYALYRLWNGTKGEWGHNFTDFCKAAIPCLKAVACSNESYEEKRKTITEMFNESKDLTNTCYKVLYEINSNNSMSEQIRICGKTGLRMLYDFGDTIEKYFPTDVELMNIAANSWKEGVYRQQQWFLMGMEKTLPDLYTAKIQKIDPSYKKPMKGGCMQKK